MTEQNKVIPLSRAIELSDGAGINKNYINIIVQEEIPILCINKKTKKERRMSFKVLYDNHNNVWQQGSDWEYYVEDDGLEKLKEKAAIKTGTWEHIKHKTAKKEEIETAVKDDDDDLEELEVVMGYGSEYKHFAGMTSHEKVEYLNHDRNKLNELLM